MTELGLWISLIRAAIAGITLLLRTIELGGNIMNESSCVVHYSSCHVYVHIQPSTMANKLCILSSRCFHLLQLQFKHAVSRISGIGFQIWFSWLSLSIISSPYFVFINYVSPPLLSIFMVNFWLEDIISSGGKRGTFLVDTLQESQRDNHLHFNIFNKLVFKQK